MSLALNKLSKSTSIDPNNLLTLCLTIRETIADLSRGIRLARLRLDTLKYVRGQIDDPSTYCFDNLFTVCNLSQMLVQQLDDLHSKMTTDLQDSVDYQIASQQLTYFTCEWYDNLIPQFNETFQIASRMDVNFGTDKANLAGTEQTRNQAQQGVSLAIQTGDTKLSDALLRLRQSMNENEKLIALIASNVEYTKTTVDAIYDSLQVTKLDVSKSERNITTAIDLAGRMSLKSKCISFIFLLLLLGLFVFVLIRWVV